MAINTVDENRLLITISPWLFRIVGGLFFCVGVVFFALVNSSYQLQCNTNLSSPEKHCQLTESIAFFYHHTTDLGHLKKAKLRSWKNKKGSRQYQIKLLADNSVTLGFTPSLSVSSLDPIIAKINQYLQSDTQPPLAIGTIASLFPSLFSSIFILVGFAVGALTNRLKIELDKTTRLMQIQRKNLLSTSTEDVSIDEIAHLELESSYSQKNQRVYRIVMRMKDEQVEPLENSYNNLVQSKIKTIQAINQFAGLPEHHSLNELAAMQNRMQKIAPILFVIALVIIVGSIIIMQLK